MPRAAPAPAVDAESVTRAAVPVRAQRVSSRHVALLCALDDENPTLRRAAAAMHVTQPAASALLAQLEQALGCVLFERHARGMRPTPSGEVMIRYARGVRHDLEHAQAEISALGRGAAGLVRVGSVMGPVPTLLTRCISAFKAANPRVRLSIQVDTSDLLMPALVRGDLDLVVGRLPDQFDADAGLVVEPFAEGEPMSVVARPGHPLLARKGRRAPQPTLADLRALTWILHPTGSPMRRRVEAALRGAHMTTALDIVETASILATTALVEGSDMISVVPRDVALHYARYGMLAIVPVALPLTLAHLGIVTRRARDLSPAASGFLAGLRAAAATRAQ
jgi:DNA-binding transcriptional LysR family regulator